MKRKIISVLIVLVMIISASTAFAYNEDLRAKVTNIKLFLNNNRVDKDIYVINEASYLPVKAISEALGLDVSWDGENRAIYLSQKNIQNPDDVVMKEFGIYEKLEKENKDMKQRISALEQENKLLKQKLSNTEKINTKDSETKENSQYNNQYTAPKVVTKVEGSKVLLKWEPIKDERLQGYKVVASKKSTNPKYPENGYLYFITDKARNYAVIDNKEPYKNGDFGKYLVPGENYYFSVTAVYKEANIAGNVVSITLPLAEIDDEKDVEDTYNYSSVKLYGKVNEGKILLSWEPIKNEKLQGYKVVISKNNSAPKYPDDGYLFWITDKNRSYAVIDNREPYKNGDFGKYLTPGEEYYISITAVYSDKNISGEPIKIIYPE